MTLFVYLFLALATPASGLPLWQQYYEEADSLCLAYKYKESLEIGLKALDEMYKAEASESDIADGLNLLVIDYHRLGLYDKALPLMEECYRLDEESGDPERISSSLNQLSAICLTLGDTDAAGDYVMRAIEVEEPLGRPSKLAVRYGNASDILLAQGRAEDALSYSQKAYELDASTGNESQMGVRLSQMAACYIELGSLQEAVTALEQAQKYLRASGNLHSLNVSCNQLGALYSKQGKHQEAVSQFEQSLALSSQTGNRLLESKAVRGLADELKDRRPREAYQYMVRFAELSDTLFSENSASLMEEFNVRYDISEKDHEIEMQKHTLKVHKTYLGILVAAVLLLVMAALVLLQLYRDKTKINRMLEKANDLKDQLLALDGAKMSEPAESSRIVQIADELSRLDSSEAPKLSPREMEVVKYCCEGLLSKEIAEKMKISSRTVETHKTNIFKKLGINTTVELVNLYNTRRELFSK